MSSEVAIVTGGNSGLGRVIADRLVADGFVVVRAGLEPATDDSMVEVDVRDDAAMDRLVREVVTTWGSLDVMVNNAGVGARPGSSVDITADRWAAQVDVNLTGTWNGCRAAITAMLDQPAGGRVVNVSSRLALSAGGPGRAAYVASKAAVSNLTRQLAVEYGRRRVRVNAVLPGYIAGTALTAPDDARLALAVEQTPHSRLGTADDVANAVAFLVSPLSEFINGHNLVVDGGASVRS